MHFQPHRVLLLILSTLLTLSFADYLSDYNDYISIQNETSYRRGLGLQKRVGGTCRSLCSAKSCCQPQLSDTDSSDDDSDLTSRSLVARTLFPVDPNNPNQLDHDIVEPFQSRQVTLIYTGADGTGDSTSNWKPIVDKSPAWNLGLSALCGCTALIVYSQNGAYGAHFFEDKAWGEVGAAGGFQKQVIDFLTSTNGAAGTKSTPGKMSLKQVSARLTKAPKGSEVPADVAAYILAPTAELPEEGPSAHGAPGYIPGVPMYQDQLNTLVELLPTIIPGLKDHIKVELYEALEGGRDADGNPFNKQQAALLDNHARGRVLMQYDPQNRGFRTVRLFFETNEVFTRRLGAST